MKLSPIAPAAGSVAAQGDRVQDLAASLPVAAAVVAPDVQVGVQAASVQRAQVQAAQMPDVDAARVADAGIPLAQGEAVRPRWHMSRAGEGGAAVPQLAATAKNMEAAEATTTRWGRA